MAIVISMAEPHIVSAPLLGGGGGQFYGTQMHTRTRTRKQKHSEAGYGWPVDRGTWTAKTVKQPGQQPAHPQYANYWAPLTRKRHTMPHSAQPQHTNYWRARKRHQQEHRPQRLTKRSNPTQHAKGRTGDCPGPRKGATTRRNVTQGGVILWHPNAFGTKVDVPVWRRSCVECLQVSGRGQSVCASVVRPGGS